MPRTVRIFLPLDLARHRPASLLGWAVAGQHWGSDDELLIVVAGSADTTRSTARLPLNERVPPLRRLGSLLPPSSETHDGSTSHTVGQSWRAKGKARQEEDRPPLDVDLDLRLRLASPNLRTSRPSQRQSPSSSHKIELSNLIIDGQNALAESTAIIQIFCYRPPQSNALQFMSLSPVPTPPAHAPEQTLPSSSQSGSVSIGALSHSEHVLQVALEESVAADPLRRTGIRPHDTKKGTSFRLAIDLINEVTSSLNRSPSERLESRPTGSETPRLDSMTALERIHRAGVRPLVNGAVLTSARCIRILRRLLNASMYIPFRRQTLCLVDILATAKQLDVRFNQLLIWPQLSHKLRKLRISGTLPARAISPSYMSVWNGVWLVANDLILGQTVGHFLRTNKDPIAELLSHALHQHTVIDVLGLLDWLGNWPAGLKLNTELSRFFGDMYSGTTQLWAQLVLHTSDGQSHPSGLGLGSASCIAHIIDIVGICGQFGGLTLILAMSVDLVNFWTLHLHLIYLVSKAIFDWFVYGIDVLFQVFRGKKRNALRGGRVDNAEYELDQRLLGTILFTLLVFLFPTVGVYYLPFAMAEWVRAGVRSQVLELGLAMLNHVPLFALMLRVKDPQRIPAGVELEEVSSEELFETGAAPVGRVRVFRIHSIPASLSHIFRAG